MIINLSERGCYSQIMHNVHTCYDTCMADRLCIDRYVLYLNDRVENMYGYCGIVAAI